MSAYYDAETESFYSDKKYNFKKWKPLLEKHFKSGGLYKIQILAAICDVSGTTFRRYLKRDGSQYKEELHEFLDRIKCQAYLTTDTYHMKSAFGKLPKANSTELNIRARHFLNLGDKEETKPTTINVNIIDKEKDL